MRCFQNPNQPENKQSCKNEDNCPWLQNTVSERNQHIFWPAPQPNPSPTCTKSTCSDKTRILDQNMICIDMHIFCLRTGLQPQQRQKIKARLVVALAAKSTTVLYYVLCYFLWMHAAFGIGIFQIIPASQVSNVSSVFKRRCEPSFCDTHQDELNTITQWTLMKRPSTKPSLFRTLKYAVA